MKKVPQSSHVLSICLVALACYAVLNGASLSLLLQEKELPRFLSGAVQWISRVSGGEFVSAQMTAALDRLTEYDRSLGQGTRQEALPEAETAPQVTALVPVSMPSPAPVEARDKAGIENPLPAEVQENAGTDKPAVALAETSAATPGPTSPSTPDPTSSASGTPTSPASGVEKPAVSSAETSAAPVTDTARKRGKSIFDTKLSRRYTVMLAGDSFMEDMILAVQRTWYNNDPNVQFISVAKHSTGLCVSTKWNWPQKLQGFVEKQKPDVVLIFMGANDLQSIFDGERKYSFTSPAWKERYVEIAQSMVDAVRQGNAVPIWIGLPIMGIEPYSKWVPLVEQLQKQACQSKGVDYIETTPLLGDAEGQYQVFKTSPSGEQVRIRKADKYHVAHAGCLMILEEVVPRLRAYILEKEKKNALSDKGAKPAP